MKHANLILFAAAALVALSSCSIKEDRVLCTSNVHVSVNDFSITQEPMPGTKAEQPVGNYAGVKAITLAFFDSEGAKKAEITQLRANAATYTTFGDFSLKLPFGDYTMVVIGYGSEVPIILSSMTFASFDEEDGKARETFLYSQNVSILNANPVNISATLSRAIARLTVKSTDNRAAAATSIRTTVSKGGKTFNPITGFATSDIGFSNCVSISTAIGAKSTSST